MPDPLASAEDVEDLWRPLTDDETARVERLIEKASALLRQATRQTIDTRIGLYATDPTDPRAVDPLNAATVVATVVKRFISNVEGVVSETDGSGPYSHSVAYALRGDKNDVRGQLIITDQDLEALAPEVPAHVGTIMVAPSPALIAGMLSARHRFGVVASVDVVIDRYGRVW
jgi:hypothetical protein